LNISRISALQKEYDNQMVKKSLESISNIFGSLGSVDDANP